MNGVGRWGVSAAILIAVMVGAILFSQNGKTSHGISVEEADSLITRDSTIVVLDVRTPGEYTGPLGHIKGSLLIPVQELEERIGELEEYKDKTILAVCRTGRRSGIATGILRENGFQAFNIEEGMVRWNEVGKASVRSE